jgi:uncharacterized protein YndB with AHSA1/START domain
MSFTLDRDILICATRETVFRFFTDSERWARWWGAGSRIDPRPGGEVFISYPGGRATAQGEVVEIQPPERIVFTYGYARPDTPIPPGGSTVTITVTEVDGGTLVRLRHQVDSAAVRDEHVDGWRYQMGVFGAVVADDQHAGAIDRIDAWFAAWRETDAAARRAALAAICAPDVVYRDRFGFTRGVEDLDGHIAAAQRHLPPAIARDGDPRCTLGVAIVPWRTASATGTSIVELAPDARIARVTGFWST